MNTIKKYLKQECQLQMLWLEHPKASDFYTSVWQTTRSPVPLLIWRTLLFICSVGIVVTSLTFYVISPRSVSFWFIYLTHWGLTLMTLVTGFGAAVSLRCHFFGPISADISLPWYVKTFWVLHNISVPLAFLISIFYWTLLNEEEAPEEFSLALDIAIHGMNSVIMFLLFISSSHPTRVVHILHPILFALTYVAFTIIYHLADGKDILGNSFIYPVVYWGNVGQTTLVVSLTGLLLMFLHFVTAGLSAARGAIAVRFIRPSVTVYLDEEMTLRRPATQHI